MKRIRSVIFSGVAAITLGLAPHQAKADEYCREYTQTFTVGGNIQQGYGVACLQPDGSWAIKSSAGSNQYVINNIQPAPVIQDVRYVYPNYYYDRPRTFFGVSFVLDGRHGGYNRHGRNWRDRNYRNWRH